MTMQEITVGEVAALLRTAAREEILPRYRKVAGHLKADGSWLTEADTAMQSRVQHDLASRWPDIPFLGEEMSAEEQQVLMQQAESGLWVLDPVDGTTNFSVGLPIFGPSLALIRGGQVVLGVVMDVMRDEVFSAALGEGAWLNGERMLPVVSNLPLSKTVACIDFKRLAPALATRMVCEPPYSSQRSIGSVALDWCWVAAGRFHVYLHGKQGLWDYAAGHLILQEVGGHSCTLDGEAVFNNTLEKRSAVCAGDARLFAEWCKALAETRTIAASSSI